MMKWRPWPPLVSRKYEVRLIVKRLLSYDQQLRESDARLMVEIKWKGNNKSTLLRRSSVAKNFTKDAAVVIDDSGATIVNWDEEFQNVCNLNAYKDNNVFHPWEIAFSLVNVCLIVSFPSFSPSKSNKKIIITISILILLLFIKMKDSSSKFFLDDWLFVVII